MAKICIRCGGQLDDRALCAQCARNPRVAEDSANDRGSSSTPRDASNTAKLFTFSAIAQYAVVPNRIYAVEGYNNRLDFIQKGSQLVGGSYLTALQENDPTKLILIGLALLLGSAACAVVVWQSGFISRATIVFAVIGLLVLSRGLLILVNPDVRKNNMSVAMSDIERAELLPSFKSIHIGIVPVAGKLILQLNNGKKLDLAISAASDIEIIKRKLLPLLGSRVQICQSKKEFDSVMFARMAIVLVVAAGIGASLMAKPSGQFLTTRASAVPDRGSPILTGDVSGCLLTVYVSTDDSVQGASIGSHSWGQEGNNMHFSCALTPSVKNYLHILVQPPANSRVFFGYFTVSGGPKFASTGSTIIDSRPESWQVSLNGWGTGYRTPAAAPNSKAYTSQDPIVDQEDPSAQTLMDPVAGVGGQQNVYFSTVINPGDKDSADKPSLNQGSQMRSADQDNFQARINALAKLIGCLIGAGIAVFTLSKLRQKMKK